MRVLVVEDEEVMADALAIGLRRAGMAVDVAREGGDGLAKAEVSPYDVVVLDRDLPVLHGDVVCGRLAGAAYPGRILTLTASATIEDRVEGLGIGADDYLTKPFAFAELVARIHALARRRTNAAPPVLSVGELTIDPARRRATRGSRDLQLSPKELGMLVELAVDPGRVVSAEQLLERVWDEHADPFTNAVRVSMVNLRRKLGDPPLIETVRGAGYRLL